MGNARKDHTTVITGEQIHRKGVEWVLGNIYITLDVDVMDPTLAPVHRNSRTGRSQLLRDRRAAEGRGIERTFGADGYCGSKSDARWQHTYRADRDPAAD